jgi:hypothetical protein
MRQRIYLKHIPAEIIEIIEIIENIAQYLNIKDLDNYANYLQYPPLSIYKVKVKQVFKTKDIQILILYMLLFNPNNDCTYLNFAIVTMPHIFDIDTVYFLFKYLMTKGCVINGKYVIYGGG